MFKFDDVHQLTDFEVENQRVFVRADFDCASTSGGQIIDDAKLRAVAPTLRWLLDNKARVVVGAARGPLGSKPTEALSIEECGAVLAALVEREILVPDDNLGPMARKLLAEQRDSQVILLQNLAFDDGEASCDDDYARALAAPFDIYVIDCLSTETNSASLVTAPKLCERRAMGLLVRSELEELNGALSLPAADTVWCVGASFPERRALLDALLRPKTTILAGTRLAKTLLAARGAEVRLDSGEQASLSQARTWLKKAADIGAEVLLPSDVTVREKGVSLERAVTQLGASASLADLGSSTLETYRTRLEASRNVWFVDALGTPGNLDGTSALLGCAGSGDRRLNVLLDGELTTERVGAGPSKSGGWLSSCKAGVLRLLSKQKVTALEALRIPL